MTERFLAHEVSTAQLHPDKIRLWRSRMIEGSSIPDSRHLNFWSRHFFLFLVALAILVRFLAAAATPMGPDFIQLLVGATTNDPAATGGPIGKIITSIVGMWTALPLSHPEPVRALASPTFLLSAELVGLVVLAKSPLIALDLLSALLIYELVAVLRESRQAAESASLLWLLNPYVVFATEMWGSPEILAISLTLLAIWLTIRGKAFIGSIALAAAIASKLFPLMFLVGPVKASLQRKSWRRTSVELIVGLLGVAGYFLWSNQISAASVDVLAKYNPQTFMFDEFTISTSTISIGVGTVALALTWLLVIAFWDWSTSSVVPASLAAALAYLAFYNWHPAALLWPLVFLAVLRDHGFFRTRVLLLLISGALFVLLSKHDAILSPSAIFFVPVGAPSLTTLRVLNRISTDEFTRGVILPVLRALFSALALLSAASIHAQNGATLKRMATELRLIDREAPG